jgi:hypothetical protein
MANHMARAERNKEEIGWLKVLFGAAVALDASLIAWLAQNYDTTQPVIASIAGILAAFFTFVVVYVNDLAYHRLRELEKL